ncbi:YqiA/YcfP family alpha/beta fold hydrolase [Dyella sp. GSA-30]|uniref:YqiA/YcfP family alpha/beta fold hydrolase n=1 Tax=Dyella sp. GSA-30 TaxID=2994496 RepID=UPI0024909C55|nr:YqiA/YcfP family alpha/beta fold hydrolase [Dyella sp. GSA-30]BDU18571.1 hypothetical protein DYGSA30_00280 [Dyella sp. GSA-30]
MAISNELEGTEPNAKFDRDLMILCRAVYTDANTMELPAGWRELKHDEYPPGVVDVAKRQGDGAPLTDSQSGFRARIFAHNEQGRGESYMVAFRGTVPEEGLRKAAAVNLGQGMGFETRQYELAERLSKMVYSSWGKNVAFTGHSLGGGLATMASVTTGNAAVIVNPAALHKKSMQRVLTSKGKTADDFLHKADQGQVRAYSVEGDFLTSNKFSSLQGPVPGAIVPLQHYLKPNLKNQGKLHAVERSVSAMDNELPSRFTPLKDTTAVLADLNLSQSGDNAQVSERRARVYNAVEAHLPNMALSNSTVIRRAINAEVRNETFRDAGQPLAGRKNLDVGASPRMQQRVVSTETKVAVTNVAQEAMRKISGEHSDLVPRKSSQDSQDRTSRSGRRRRPS